MKTLILIRHAKSSWKHPVSDIQRPLNKRGKTDAKRVALHTKSVGFPVDAVFVSPAKRTQETAKYFIKHWGIDKRICKTIDDLYDFSGNDLLGVIKNINDNYQHIMLFGHNHALTSFVNDFGNRFIDNVPTCGFLLIQFDIEKWADLKQGYTLYKAFPKEF